MLMQSLGGRRNLAAFLRFNGRVAAVTARFEMAKSSEKALVKRFCEKNFTEFLSDLKKRSTFFNFPHAQVRCKIAFFVNNKVLAKKEP